MKNMRFRLAALLAPMMTLAIVLAGCGGDKGGDKSSKAGGSDGGSDKAVVADGTKKAIEGKGRGTLKGTVTYDGTPPSMASADKAIQEKMKIKDEKNCLMGASDEEKAAFEWRVNPKNNGVKNVFVWLAPGDGAYFKLSEAEKKPAQATVVIDQPHCAFTPHCAVAFTCFNEGKSKLPPTGQKVIFKNSSGTSHNTNYKGLRSGDGGNPLIPPGGEVTPDLTKAELVTLSCEIHTWMRGYLRNFDHPFAAVTDEDGNFVINNVPTGVPVQLVVCHEMDEYGEGGQKGKTVTLKDGENTENLKIKAK